MLAYFILTALVLLWAEWSVGQNTLTRGEQLVVILTWPIFVGGVLLFGAMAWLFDFAEAIDRWFDEWSA